MRRNEEWDENPGLFRPEISIGKDGRYAVRYPEIELKTTGEGILVVAFTVAILAGCSILAVMVWASQQPIY